MDHQEIMNRVSPRPFTLYYRASLFSGRGKGWVREENNEDENKLSIRRSDEVAQRQTVIPNTGASAIGWPTAKFGGRFAAFLKRTKDKRLEDFGTTNER